MTLADTDQERAEAQRLLSTIPTETTSKLTAPATSAAAANPPSVPDPNGLIVSCQKNDEAACAQLAPLAEKRCAEGEKRACLVTAMLQFRGTGVPKDEPRALSTLEQLCDGGLFESCTQWAAILASGQKPDMAKARQLLTKSCDGGLSRACEMLKSLPK